MNIPFAHLHNHSMFSCLDGIAKPKEAVARAVELGYQAMALTDHGTLAGSIQHYKECIQQKLQPILGIEAYICPDISVEDRSLIGHITVLAKDKEGYQNLLKLVTKANREGFYHKPRIDWNMLREFGQGLIVLSGCMTSPISKQILAGVEDTYIKALINSARNSCEHFFLEIMNSKIPEQEKIARKLIQFGKELEIPVVATLDSHYVYQKDYLAQATARAIDFGKTIKDEGVFYSTNEYYLKSWDELLQSFDKQHLLNTLLISELVDFDLSFHGVKIPKFSNKFNLTSDQLLQHLVRIGWEKRKINEKGGLYKERLRKELEDIRRVCLQDYFLIVWDIVRFCDEQQIPRGDGRGSAAGSLILYLLGVTKVDPIKYGLYWERFYNAGRGNLVVVDGENYIQGSMPDVDLDFSFVRRSEILKYLAEKYNSAAKLSTFSTLSARQVIRDAGKAFGMSEIEVSHLTDLVPKQAYKITLEEFIDTNEHVRSLASSNEATPCGETWKQLFHVCRTLEGCYRHQSIHASAIVVSNEPLENLVPMVQIADNEDLAIGYEMEDTEALGLIKIDCLGVRSLDIVDETIKLAEEKNLIEDETKLFTSDVNVWQLISRGDTALIFQLDSNLGADVARSIKPQNIKEISDCISLQRPGPNNLLSAYCKNRKSKRIPSTGQKELDTILAPTQGQLIYQEQVIQIASQLAGYDLKDADQLRKVLGKKEKEKILEHREHFISSYKYGSENGSVLWDQIERFADYSFNFSHGLSYALLTWKTAWLKQKFPIQFYLANLRYSRYEQNAHKEIIKIIIDAKSHGIRISPPSIRLKNFDFEQVDEKTIAFGLYHLKNIGEKAKESIEKFTGTTSTDVLRFCRNINKRVASAMIKSGCFDELVSDRIELYWTYCLLLELTDKEFENLKDPIDLESLQNYQEYVSSRTIKRRGPVLQNKLSEIQNAFLRDKRRESKTIAAWELETIGFANTFSLMEAFTEDAEKKPQFRIKDLSLILGGQRVSFIGQISSLRKCLTRRTKEPMALGMAQDDGFQTSVVFFPATWQACQNTINENTIAYIEGIKKEKSIIVSKAIAL